STIDIAPGAQKVPVAISPKEPQTSTWSGVAVSFDQVQITLDPRQVLDKVHELSSSSAPKTELNILSIQLKHPEFLPDTLKSLLSLHLQVRKGLGAPIDVFLTRDAYQKTVPVAFTLADLMAGMSPQQPVVQWRVANMLPDKTGDFSDWQTNNGSDLIVQPN